MTPDSGSDGRNGDWTWLAFNHRLKSMRIRICPLFVLALLGLVLAGPAANSQAQDFLKEPKPLAEGVLQVIPAELDARDSFSMPMRLPDLTAESYQGNFTPTSRTLMGQATNVILFRDVWQLEFATTGLRQVKLTFARPDGSQVDRHFWYMAYRIRDFGKSLSYEQVSQQAAFEYVRNELRFDVAKTDRSVGPRKFLPRFTLEGWVEDRAGNYVTKEWRDVYSPEVARQIQQLEDPNVRLYNQQEISELEIPLAENETSPGIWGVAIWEDVDPALDYVTVQVRGLTNAWRIDPASHAATKLADVQLQHKTLQMNFWRPGDEVAQHRDLVRYGIPLVDDPAVQVDICRRYRLPGPVLNVYFRDPVSGQDVLLTSVDGQISMADFTSPLTGELNSGKLPEAVGEALTAMGLEVPAGTPVTAAVEDRWWTTQINGPNGPQQLSIRMEPRFWEKKEDGIRFIGTLDHFWVYR